jgi:prepilin-type N-terminal cleavage/methylation domain-containing protein
MGRPNRSCVVTHGFSLVEILVVAALLAVLGIGLAYRYTGGNRAADRARAPLTGARAVACLTNLRSVRQAIAAAQASDSDGKFPQSLEELRLPAEILRCDVGHEPYVYNPATGQVSCVHPGHEGY